MKHLLLAASILFCAVIQTAAAEFPTLINCEGAYNGHLQGTDARGTNIWWSFTKKIVRTDLAGKVLASCDAPRHQGDLCVKGDTLYVAVNLGRFNTETLGVSAIFSFDAMTLEKKKTWSIDMPMGAGGITWKDDRFYVVGGLPPTHQCNYVHEFDSDFNLIKRHTLNTGYTTLGIQTAAFIDGEFIFGIYGSKSNPKGLLRCSADFKKILRYTSDASLGLAKIEGRLYSGISLNSNDKENKWCGALKYVKDLFPEKALLTCPWYSNGVLIDAMPKAATIEIGTANGSVSIKPDSSWRVTMKSLAAKGFTAILIDVADGFAYPSQPKLAAKDAWSVQQIVQALAVARNEGLEPIPYLDFTEPRNAWLGKNKPSCASPKSVKTAVRLIKDLANAFGKPRFFHIKIDGLEKNVVNQLNDAVTRGGYGSCLWDQRDINKK